jgi:HlyD family secretion protein
MDRPRTDRHIRRRKRLIVAAGVAVLIGGVSLGVASLQPAPPTIERNLVWIDTVKRGAMLRQVRGTGTLVPEDIRWIAARTQGRVEKILLRPGAQVTSDSVILELTNPDVVQAAADADAQLEAAEAELVNLKVQLQRDLLAAESAAAGAKAEFEQARLRSDVNDRLFKDHLVSELDLKVSQVTAANARTRSDIEQKRYLFAKESVDPQVAVKSAGVSRMRTLAALRHAELDALTVRAGMNGVLQLLPVEVGAQVAPGANLARVADPTRLKAEVRVAETQAKDIEIGQPASVDTRNGVVEGRVTRIDPSVQNGTVMVDVAMLGPLPAGARPDLTVDGTIELERLTDVTYVGRPAYGAEQSVTGIYRLDADGTYATRTNVRLGRGSVSSVEILAGLAAGDRVILSDMSQWAEAHRIRLK